MSFFRETRRAPRRNPCRELKERKREKKKKKLSRKSVLTPPPSFRPNFPDYFTNYFAHFQAFCSLLATLRCHRFQTQRERERFVPFLRRSDFLNRINAEIFGWRRDDKGNESAPSRGLRVARLRCNFVAARIRFPPRGNPDRLRTRYYCGKNGRIVSPARPGW